MTNPIVEKACSCCKVTKPLDEFRIFAKAGKNAHGRDGQCKMCLRAKARARWHKEKDPNRSRDQHLFSRYGMRIEDYEHLLASQHGACAICGYESRDGKRLRVDHCHETGQIRGLLCSTCNTGLGGLGDSIEGVKRALDYLIRVEKQMPPQPMKTKLPPRKGRLHHWCTKPESKIIGEQSTQAKLNEEKVRDILRQQQEGTLHVRSMAKKYNVSVSLIYAITYREAWRHVTI